MGLDFPFGLPHELVGEGTWQEFALAFPGLHPGPEEFKNRCLQAARRIPDRKKDELKRATDFKARTPFSPYNLRLFRQTYYGIRDILRPLVERDQARVLPMQAPAGGKAIVVEICPRSALIAIGLGLNYAGVTAAHTEARQQILAAVLAGQVSIPDDAVRQAIVADTEGDALSSVIAATATFRAVRRGYAVEGELNPRYGLEGYVYV